ncbi:hypothetical protein Droror1_Dr00012916 [Drosera rotundifolia]
MMAHQRLSTQDRLIGMGRLDISCCIFCDTEVKSYDHVFFTCSFAAAVFQEWAVRYKEAVPMRSCKENVKHMAIQLTGVSFRKRLTRKMFCYGSCHFYGLFIEVYFYELFMMK